MKKLAILVLSACLVASMSTAAMANDVVVSFDAAGTQGSGPAGAFVLFSVYIIGQEIGDVVGWELAMVPPPGITVSVREINNGPGVNLGGPDNYLIGLGDCYGTPGADYQFARYDMVYLAAPPADDLFCLAVPDGNGAEAGFLAYVSCSNTVEEMGAGNLGCTDSALDGCAVINPSAACVVATEQSSWGAVKAAY